MVAEVEHLINSPTPEVSKLAGLALAQAAPPTSLGTFTAELKDKEPNKRLYGAMGIVNCSKASQDDIVGAIDSLKDLLSLPVDIDRIMKGNEDENTKIVGTANAILKETATRAGLRLPQQDPIPLEVIQKMKKEDVAKLGNQRIAELTLWWDQNKLIAARNLLALRTAAATKPTG
jgi:hypothetical protein